MNFLKELVLINKVKKSIKQAKKMIDTNKGLAEEVKKILASLKVDIEALLNCLPQFKPIYKEIKEIVKEIF